MSGIRLHLPGAPRRLPWLVVMSVAVIALDRWTKLWVTAHVELGRAITVWPGVFRITHVLNEGAAFSLFADSASPEKVRLGLVIFTLAAVAALAVALVYVGQRVTRVSAALALVLGGAIGNVYDRIHYAYVVDFLEVHIVRYHWPDFNVADSAIVTGACLLMLDALLSGADGQSAAEGDAKTTAAETTDTQAEATRG